MGTVSLQLVGQSPSGTVYRLRDAVVAVDGPAYSETWDTEDDPDRTSLSADVDVGEYEVELAEGWRLERLAPPEPPVTVDATLLSDNPLAFAVSAGARTRVPLRFRVEDGDVELDQGYDIEIEVEEPLPPAVTITSVPSPTSDSTPTISFVVTASGAVSTECRLDGGAFAACTSPYTTPALSDGAHVIHVRATDGMGRTGDATAAFVVDTVAPSVIITSGPTQVVYSTTTTFTFSASGSPTNVECRSYARGAPSGAFVSCSSPTTWAVQFPTPPASYAPWTFEVRVTDAAGNARSATWDYATAIII